MIKIAVLSLFSLITLQLFGQEFELVKSDPINYSIHQKNIGKIVFTHDKIDLDKLVQSDFLNEFEFKNNSDLNIRVFLKKSLTNNLHLIHSGLSVDELNKNGNYQFTFFLDGKMIYRENLHPGAGTIESKKYRTTFRIPLLSTSNEDSWGRFLWDRFYSNGGQEALESGEHDLKIEIRPYLKTDELIIGDVIAEGQIKLITPKITIDEKLVKVQPIMHHNEWGISSEKIDTTRIEELNRRIISQFYKEITSIVVIKNDKILVEEYFNGSNRKTLHDTRSVGKSFASTLLGIAISDQYLKNEHQTLNEFYDLKSFTNHSPLKDRITLKSLLTMNSMFDGSDMNSDSPGNEENMYPTKNWVEFALNLSIDSSKLSNNKWDYFTAGVVIIGDIINKSVPIGLEKYADQKLFNPLNIRKYKWVYTPQKIPSTAGGLRMSSLDFAKYGQLYKNNGHWKGKQIVPTEWINKSLSKQVIIDDNEFYGYLFWNKNYRVKEKDYQVYYSSGNGGNKIFMFADQPIVIVITSTAYNKSYAHKQVDKIMQDFLIPAILD